MASPFTQYPSNIIRPKQVNWDVLSEAFEIVKRHWQSYVIYAVVALIGTYAVSFCMQMPMQGLMMAMPTSDDANLAPFLAGFVPLYLLNIVVSTVVQGMLYAGFHLLTMKVLSGRNPEVGDAFEMFKLLVPIGIAQLLAGLFAAPGLCLCGIGYMFTYGLFAMSVPVVLVEKKSGWDAVMRSLELTKQHWLNVGLFIFVSSLLAGLGAIACCVGLLFTMPWAAVSNFLLYRDLSGATFGDPNAVASATPYPRSGPGDMPTYTGPVSDIPPSGPASDIPSSGPVSDFSKPFDAEAAASSQDQPQDVPDVPPAPEAPEGGSDEPGKDGS